MVYFSVISVAIASVVILLCVPTFLAHEIYEPNPDLPGRFSIGFSSRFTDDGCALLSINLWLTGIMLKVSAYCSSA